MSEEEIEEIKALLDSVHTFLNDIVKDLPNDKSKMFIKESMRNVENAKKEVIRFILVNL